MSAWRSRALAIAGLLAGCDWFDGVDNDAAAEDRRRAAAAARELAAPRITEPATAGLIVSTEPVPASVADGPSRAGLGAGVPATVVLIVLDAVRADHLALCGYGRPTSPALATLTTMGGAGTCDAYAPATWTLPSHATLFTGQGPEQHDLHRKGLRLAEEATTLAELFAARGYQTLAISGNPVLKPGTGLMQGFQRLIVPPHLASPLRGEGMSALLKSELARLDRTRPLFLFLNVFDAHDPYPEIPEGVAWAPPRPAFRFDMRTKDATNPYYRYIEGQMEASEREAWLAHATDTYDFGVAIADRSMGRMLKLLQRQGWIEHGVRMVVTADHGEHLGEHGILRHDGPPWEAVARVPFFYIDTSGAPPVALPEPFPIAHTFHLLAHGALDPAVGAPVAASVRYGAPDPRYVDAVATWGAGGDKLLWWGGETRRFALAEDPGEARPVPVGAHPLASALTGAVEAHLASKARAMATPADDEVVRMLGDLGYVDE